jgi:hypothetical protein
MLDPGLACTRAALQLLLWRIMLIKKKSDRIMSAAMTHTATRI